ncbi:MAG: TolC family protein, partial [Bacteroidales bacterium]|nr:TolC family protein [Bacteroidales bacterium]
MRRTLLIPILLLISLAAPAREEGARVISLGECLELGMRNDPYVRNASLDVSSAKSRKAEAMWEYFPDVSISAFAYYAVNPLIKIGITDILGTSDAAWEINSALSEIARENGIKPYYAGFKQGFGIAASAIQPVYAGGRIAAGNKLASLGVKAAEIQKSIRERDTREEIEKKYWMVVSLQEKKKTLSQAMELMDSLLSQAGAARDAGVMLESDYMKLSRKRSELLSGESALRGGLRLAKMDLFNSIGLDYEYIHLDEYVFEEPSTELVPPSRLLDGSGTMPDESRLLEMQVEARKLEKRMAVGEYLPEVGVGLSYGYGNLQNNNFDRMNAVGFASVKIPLTGIGKATERAKRYEAALQKSLNEKQYLDSQLILQQQKLYLEAQTAYDR